MQKNTLLKKLTTINSQLFRNTSFRNYFQIISNKTIFSYKNMNIKMFLTDKRFFSTQEANISKNNAFNDENLNKTDLVIKEKKKKNKNFKSKTEEGKSRDKAEAKIDTAEKSTVDTHENVEGQSKAETENVKIEKENVYIYSKEEQQNIKKIAFKNKIKEAINLKDMYQIQSSKMGAVNPRKFFDFTKFRYPNVSVKVYDKATFTADEKHDGKNLTPVSPKLGPYIVSLLKKFIQIKV